MASRFHRITSSRFVLSATERKLSFESSEIQTNENVDLAKVSSFVQSALQNLNLFGLACVAGAEREGGGRKARKRGKGKGAAYQLSSIPIPFFHSPLSPTFFEACDAGKFGHPRAT